MVDLWGGTADQKTGAPWTKDTVSIVFSCTKGATALCAHVLASRGKLDLDAPVAELWPEFAQNGKERATTRMMLDHSVGVPALRAKVKDSGPYEWDYMTGLLAEEAPFWEPGTRNGYHGFTFGWTVGEMVRRAAGVSLGTFFQDEIAKPLGLDFWIGLPEAIEPRVAPIIPYVYKAERGQDAVHDRSRRPGREFAGVAVLLQRRRLAHRRRQHARRPRRRDRRGQRRHQCARAGRHVCAAGATAAASWSTARRSRAWARSRWRRTTTPPCASRRALRWAS